MFVTLDYISYSSPPFAFMILKIIAQNLIFFNYYKKSLRIISNIAPGIPSIPTTNVVITFKPIWKLYRSPIEFTKNIIIAPNNEFPNIFNIIFSGTKKNLPIKNMITIQPKNIITLFTSKFISNIIPYFLYIFMITFGQIFLNCLIISNIYLFYHVYFYSISFSFFY